MAIIRCKMCGGNLVFDEGATVGECEYCGSKQTIPTVDSEKKMKLFDRANRLRINCEFDKAGSVYESIIEEFPEEAEGYWGNLLCKYGIEYVDDPVDGSKVPTCHRSSFESFMDDEDFEMVMENADVVARAIYREQAKQIEEIRKGIVEVSAKEQPYDIFICYKETDDNGNRTLDSVLAQDVYESLTSKGYRVFFSRISLEDKLGTEYEPYIFAALNSAKIMLAFGTSYDYYYAVWVKNEWSRFLRLMAKDKTKHLIPCYKDVDAYDIPKEFAKLQAQDMGKVGAVQDLMRGIDKLMGKDGNAQKRTTPQTITQQVFSGPTADSMIERGNMSLADGEYKEAVDFFNRALDMDPRSSRAYLGLLMADMQVKNPEAAKTKFIAKDYTSNRNWSRAKQFASEKLSIEFQSWEKERKDRLDREAEEKRRKREEERRKREEKEQKERQMEEDKKRIQSEISRLQQQLQGGKYEMTSEERTEENSFQIAAEKARETAKQAEESILVSPEYLEATRLEEEIKAKKERMNGLSFFKGKEKREIQAQIDVLADGLDVVRAKIEEKQNEIVILKNEAEKAIQKASEYHNSVLERKAHALFKRIIELSTKIEEPIMFGRYEQGYGIAPIEWQVLKIEDDRVLLISKYAIERKKYFNLRFKELKKEKNTTWEACSLRTWLNKDFLDVAFNEEERKWIMDTKCSADPNPKNITIPAGNSTNDKVFLLSIKEVQKYFDSDSARGCIPTHYAVSQGAYRNIENGKCCWILRSPGDEILNIALVRSDGTVSYKGCGVLADDACVRPALWINLNF